MKTRDNILVQTTASIVGVVPVDPAQEEENHQRMLDLTPQSHDALALLDHGLGDPSWRVRKAAQQAVQRFDKEPKLLPILIGGLGSQDNAGLRNACAEVLIELGERSVADLARALNTADVDQRKFVVEILGVIGSESALEALLTAMQQSDSNVRSAVVDALGNMGGPRITALLRERLQATQSDLQLSVYLLDALARCQAVIPASELQTYLQHRQLTRFVYPLLGLSQDEAAMPLLVEAVKAGSRALRRAALPALATLLRGVPKLMAELEVQLRHPAMQAAINDMLTDEDDHVVAATMLLLSHSGDAAGMPRMLEVGMARGLVQAALEAAAALGPPVVGPLLAAMDRTDVQSALLFLDVIEAVGDGAAVPALLDMLDTHNVHLCGATVRVLGRLGGSDVIEPLMQLARRRDEQELGRQVVGALGQVGSRLPDAVAKALHRAIATGDVHPTWLGVLGTLHRAEDIALIAAACRHLDPEVRRAALEAGQSFGSRLPETTVRTLLADEHPRVRAAAARVSGAYTSDGIVDALLQSLNDFDPWVVAEAARALGTAGQGRALPNLRNVARSQSAPVAIAALQALARLHDPLLEHAITHALRHLDSEVVREALHVATGLSRSAAYHIMSEALRHRAWDVRWAAAEVLTQLDLHVDAGLLMQVLTDETEPLVRDKLARLTPGRGAPR